MQRVITIRNTNYQQDGKVIEDEYPKLQKYLDQGFTIKQVIPIQTNSDKFAFMYSLTFILVK